MLILFDWEIHNIRSSFEWEVLAKWHRLRKCKLKNGVFCSPTDASPTTSTDANMNFRRELANYKSKPTKKVGSNLTFISIDPCTDTESFKVCLGSNQEIMTKKEDENEKKQKEDSQEEKKIYHDDFKKEELEDQEEEDDNVMRIYGVQHIAFIEKEKIAGKTGVSVDNQLNSNSGPTKDLVANSDDKEDVMPDANNESDWHTKENKNDISTAKDSEWGGDNNLGVFGEVGWNDERHIELQIGAQFDDAANEDPEEWDTSFAANEAKTTEDLYSLTWENKAEEEEEEEEEEQQEEGMHTEFSPIRGSLDRWKTWSMLGIKGIIESMLNGCCLQSDIEKYLESYSKLKKDAKQIIYELIPLLSYCTDKDLSRLTCAIMVEKDSRQSLKFGGEIKNPNSWKQSSVCIQEIKVNSNGGLPPSIISDFEQLVESSARLSVPKDSQPSNMYEAKSFECENADLPSSSEESNRKIAESCQACWTQILKYSRHPDVWTVEFCIKCMKEFFKNGRFLISNPAGFQQKETFMYQLLTKSKQYWLSAVINENVKELEALVSAGWPVEFHLLSNNEEARKRGLPKRDASLWNSPALLIACSYGFYKSAEVLLEIGASIHAENEFSCETALSHSCKNGHVQITKLLLGRSADPNTLTIFSSGLEQARIGCVLVMDKRIENRLEILGELIFYGAKTYEIDEDQFINFDWYKKDLVRVCAIEKEMESLELGMIRRFDFIHKQLFRYAPMLSDTIISFLNPLSCPELSRSLANYEDLFQDDDDNHMGASDVGW